MPKPLQGASTPNLIELLKTEWDASMLEIFNLRKSLQDTRQELAHALYKFNAAERVVARLLSEKDSATRELKVAREELNNCKMQLEASRKIMSEDRIHDD